jgi:hypothetical protein
MHIAGVMTTTPRTTPTLAGRSGSRLALALLLSVPLASACAGGGATTPAPAPGDALPDARGVPGFDTRDHPGEGVMERWLAESPYRWVGFYLPAPCYTGTTWQGKRQSLRDMGWGLAVLFVGEQDWAAAAGGAGAVMGADPEAREAGARCTRGNLSLERGREDGAAAAAAAGAEGFATETVVYLDVERVEYVSDDLVAYVRGWTRGLAGTGYAPGLYAHARNAEELLAVMADAAGADAVTPRLWVASTGGFHLRRGPTESGFPATVWQGVLDTHETWGGTTLRIDQNVADRRDPSG